MSEENVFSGFIPKEPTNQIAASLTPKRKSRVIPAEDVVVQLTAQVPRRVRDKLNEMAITNEVSAQVVLEWLILNTEPQPLPTPTPKEEIACQLSTRVSKRAQKKVRADAKTSGLTVKAYLDWLITKHEYLS